MIRITVPQIMILWVIHDSNHNLDFDYLNQNQEYSGIRERHSFQAQNWTGLLEKNLKFMFIKHINPILLNKSLKSPQEMWTLLAYLKAQLFLLFNCNKEWFVVRCNTITFFKRTLPENSSGDWLQDE